MIISIQMAFRYTYLVITSNLAARDDTGRQRRAMIEDLARPGEPNLVPLGMRNNVTQRFTKWRDTVRLANDHGMEGNPTDEGLLPRLTQHFLELIDDHACEIFGGMAPYSQGGGIVNL